MKHYEDADAKGEKNTGKGEVELCWSLKLCKCFELCRTLSKQ
jgi:hypothetical protein